MIRLPVGVTLSLARMVMMRFPAVVIGSAHSRSTSHWPPWGWQAYTGSGHQGPFHQGDAGLGIRRCPSDLNGHAARCQRKRLALQGVVILSAGDVVSMTVTVTFCVGLTFPALSRARTVTVWALAPGKATVADQFVVPVAAWNGPLPLSCHSTTATLGIVSAASP